jgi:glyoxylase-like metal-dependent hydrolase (beta-lactamase superfamily II)
MRHQRGFTLSRRHLLKGAIGSAAGLVFGASATRVGAVSPQAVSGSAAPASAAGAGPGTAQRLADDLFVLQLPGEANVVAHTTPGGVVLVDGGSAKASAALMKMIGELPGGGGRADAEIQTLFNTHWHPEQTGLNEALGKAGKTIISHENTRLWLSTDITWSWSGQRFTRLPKIAQPNKTFYTMGKLDSGITYGYIPDAAHTDGDMYVYFPKQNVLAVGDVMSNQGWPVVDWQTGGWIGGIAGAMQRLQTLVNAETRIVPGRGSVLGLAELKAQTDMYGTIYGRLTTLLNKGRGPSEAVAEKPTKEFDAQMGNPDEFVRRSFESLWAYLSPDA